MIRILIEIQGMIKNNESSLQQLFILNNAVVRSKGNYKSSLEIL